MIAWLRRALRTIEDVIWPRNVFCLICEELADEGSICDSCRERLAGLRMRDQHGPVRSAYQYAAGSKELVISLKFDGVVDAAEFLAEVMAEEARAFELPEDTVVTWVTMPRGRQRVRGVDHGRTLATAVARRLKLPVQQLLTKDENTRTQLGLSAAQRRENLKGRMHCDMAVDHPVLLVDDVITTGSTVRVCAELLYAAGAPQVYALSAMRVGSKQLENLWGG